MLTKELIKCHLLNEDVVVRQAIYRYFNNYNTNISQNLINTFANEKKMLKKLNKFYNKYKFEDVVINNK
ncbi:MAG: hypothetical protein MJA31_06100 [Clostridia bacterium]|nr:hypothetical protein [Clostridia bacterium]